MSKPPTVTVKLEGAAAVAHLTEALKVLEDLDKFLKRDDDTWARTLATQARCRIEWALEALHPRGSIREINRRLSDRRPEHGGHNDHGDDGPDHESGGTSGGV